MIVIAMADRAHDGVLVGYPGESRQMLADGQTWDVRGNGLKFAADFLGSIGFRVPSFKVRRPAVIEDQDAGFGFAETAGRGRPLMISTGRRGAAAQVIRPHQPGKSQAADAKNLASIDAVAQANTATADRKHRAPLVTSVLRHQSPER